jgi:segregation and condensation protein A
MAPEQAAGAPPAGAPDDGLNAAADAAEASIARLYGEPMLRMPNDLYIPPDAL